ncbi:MAG: hypothetical protein WD749_15055 [Phycisphaerales bacterium]
MTTTGPIVGSLQISRAYGVVVRPVSRAAAIARVAPAPPHHEKPGASLVAGTVPGRINFSGGVPQPGESLAMYRHPADRNAAATAVSAGKLVDVTG